MSSSVRRVPLASLISPVETWSSARESRPSFEYIDIGSIDREKKQICGTTRVEPQDAPSRAKYIVRTGDILVSTVRPNLNAVAVVPPPLSNAIASSGFAVLRIDEREAVSSYIFHWVRTQFFIDDMVRQATGASYPAVSNAIVGASEVPLLTVREQQRVSAILDKADAIRRKRQEAIALTEQLLRSTFLEMFGDPVTNPKHWPISPFGDVLGELRYGTSQKCSDRPEPGMMPVLRIPNIAGGVIDASDLKYTHLADAELELTRLRDGDILFVRSNGNPEYIGRCAVFHGSDEYAFASYLIRGRIRADANFSVDFAQAVMSFPSFRAQLVREARTTAGNYNISTEGLRNLRLIHPPLDLQQAFLRRANGVARLAKRYADSLSEADHLFNSLVQRAFSGQL